MCASVLPAYIRCNLYLPACVETKAQAIVITGRKKMCFKKVQKLKKKSLA